MYPTTLRSPSTTPPVTDASDGLSAVSGHEFRSPPRGWPHPRSSSQSACGVRSVGNTSHKVIGDPQRALSPASPFSRHAAATREKLRGTADAYVTAAEISTWAKHEGPAASAEEQERRILHSREVRTVQSRCSDFLDTLRNAADREADFMFKSEKQSTARPNGIATAIVSRNRAAQIESVVLDLTSRTVAHEGHSPATDRGGFAISPPTFSFALSDFDKHVIMCVMMFAVSADMISNDAEFRSRVGWYRGDVAAQFDKLAATFAEWSCICYNRGVTWNMLHNCFTEARKPVKWSEKPTTRAAYFGRVSQLQVEALHDRLLCNFANSIRRSF